MTEKRNFDLTSFQRAKEKIVALNADVWNEHKYGFHRDVNKIRDYSLEEVDKIIASSNLESHKKLSRNYFMKDGFYRRIILHYATILTYSGLLIPNPKFGKKLSTPHIQKRYYSAMDYVDNNFTSELFVNWSIRALVDGAYYGLVTDLSKDNFVLLELPSCYCRNIFKDINGRNIVELDVTYFNSILDEEDRRQALSVYPKFIGKHYHAFKKGLVESKWVKIPTEIGFCFTLTNDARPLFLNVIPATIQYDSAVDTERERDLEEIRKIIVQKVPHLNDGTLLFEPEEAAEMHAGAVEMMKGNKNVSILTTYTDVDSIISKTSADTVSNGITTMKQNIYSEAGASGEIFSPSGVQAINTSITNDAALMMILADKYSSFITYILNDLFSNGNISFKYKILPINHYQRSDYLTDALKMAQSGYSWLLPNAAMGMSQKELINIKELENEVLGLKEILIPLSSSYTQSSEGGATDEGGAPEKKTEEKSEKTIMNEDSINNQGGSN